MDTVFGAEQESKRESFFKLVFGQHEGYVCIAFLTPGPKKKFREEFYRYPEEIPQISRTITENLNGVNLYFCPQLLRERKREKQHVEYTPNVWADLDFCEPRHMLVEPSITVESSPGRYQAYWILERENDPDDVEDIARRIAYKHAEQGADRSGWDLTQLLRIPYTYNYKHNDSMGNHPVVEVLDANRNVYRMSDFVEYPKSPEYNSIDIPPPDDDYETRSADEILQSRRTSLNPQIWGLYAEVPGAEVKSWSEILWRLLMLLYESGFTREEIFTIAKNAGCNKYGRDGRPVQQLWKEVCRAEGKHELHERLLVPNPEEFEPLLTNEERGQIDAAGDTFIERYATWASKLGDAAPQYHQAGAFIALSSLLAGSVRLQTSYGTVIPNIWFMILADTTLTRKTTAMDIAMDLILEVDDEVVMATDGSLEGLLTSLSTRPGKPSIFLRDEFSGLLEQMAKKDYMAGMPELLTKLYDGKMQKRVLRKETIEVRDPRLIIFAGGIKNKITSLLNFDMVSSGFMPRFIFITAESDLDRVRPIGPPTTISTGDRDAVLAELTDMYKHYSRTQTVHVEKLRGNVTTNLVTDAVMDENAWLRYNKLESQMLERGLKSTKPEIMTPIGDRLSKSMLKAALLIAAARQRGEGDVVIEEIDILRAIKYGEQWSAHGQEVMDNVGKNDVERKFDTILKVIVRNPGGISRSALMQAYHLTARDATFIFETLEQRGMITRRRQGRLETLFATNYALKEDEPV